MKAFKPHLQGLPSYPYKAAEARIKLDQNESPYDLPPEIKRRALERLAHLDWNRYPALHAEDVRAKLGERLSWPAEGIAVSPGSNLLIQALVQAANRVVDTAPAFPHYAFSAKMSAAPYQQIPLISSSPLVGRGGGDFTLPTEELLLAMNGEPALVFLPNPHAPTGQLFPQEDIEQLAHKARETGGLLVLDEAYHQFSGSNYTPLVRENPHVALLRTFSKAWGLGGIRAGYLLGSAEVCNLVQNFIPPFGLPAHTSAILLTVLETPEYSERIVEVLLTEREKLYAALQKHPTWTVYPSHTNFFLIRTPDAAAAYKGLLERGILVRRQDHYFGLEGCIRVSVGTPEENERFLQAAFALPEVSHA
ncbi:MAG: histidinol-phosphate aminotransferase [Meiothermus sp.]